VLYTLLPIRFVITNIGGNADLQTLVGVTIAMKTSTLKLIGNGLAMRSLP